MPKHQLLLSTGLSTLLTLTVIAGGLLWFGWAAAAPARQLTPTPLPIMVTPTVSYLSVSGLAFEPVDPSIRYQKDTHRQMLTLSASPGGNSDLFIAPLLLPDASTLAGLTMFGEDFDNQGAVLVRLNRCDHSQARCVSLAETTSTVPYAAGQFETLKAAIANEVVNNYFYSYILELELTAQAGSGLRAVRLELAENSNPVPVGNTQRWELTGDVTNFLIPTQGLAKVRVCAGDLSHLNNPTHYPSLIVDGVVIPMASNSCATVSGYTIQIRRELNTGPSSGTYTYLR